MSRGAGPEIGARASTCVVRSVIALAAFFAVGGAAPTGVFVGRALAALLAAARLAGAALLAAVAARALLLVGVLVWVVRPVRMVRHGCLRWSISSARET